MMSKEPMMSEENPQLLSRDALLSATERRYKIVGPLPVRGGHCRIRSLDEQEAASVEAANYTSGDLDMQKMLAANCRWIVACLVDGAGNRLLSPADVPRLMKWDRADVEHLYTEVKLHVRAKQRPMEEIEKNSAGTPAAV
jgi:hypothetical protein